MRVIAGQHRGRGLAAPKGTKTRPTTDRVRESLFSMLASARGGFDEAVVLDLFAGSGALGIEALSRGATFACFCEKDRTALHALSQNTSFLEPVSFRVASIDVEKRLPPSAAEPFDLILLDPPYAFSHEQLARVGKRLDEAGLVAPDALLSLEHATQTPCPGENDWLALQWEHVNSRTFGDTSIDLFRRTP